MSSASDNTDEDQTPWRFKPGVSGNPAGRPKGSRNRLSERFVAEFCEVWEEHGIAALRKLATTDCAVFVRVAASLLPRQHEHSGPDGSPIETGEREFSDLEVARMVARLLLKAGASAVSESDPDGSE